MIVLVITVRIYQKDIPMLIPVQYIIIAFLALTTVVFTIFLRPKLSRFSQILGYLIIIFIVVSYALHENRHSIDVPLRHFLDFRGGEFNHTATVSSLLLFATGAAALTQAMSRKAARWNFIMWVYVASLFVFLATDEYFLIHERLANWEEIYIAVAGFTTIFVGTVVWFKYKKIQFFAFVLLIGGIGTAAVGGVVLENVVADACFELIPYNYCTTFPILEEIFEITGYATCLMAMLLFIEQTYSKERWQRVRLYFSALAMFWLAWTIFSYWMLPSVELRYLATPVEAEFVGGRMTLRGYTINPDYVRTGDTVTVRLYWYSAKAPVNQYGFTVNMVDPVGGESIVRINSVIDAPATEDWFANTVHWTELEITIPDDIETPISPLVIATVWQRNPQGDYETFVAENSSVRVLNSGPILTSLPILSHSPDDNGDGIEFANGLQVTPRIQSEDEGQLTINFDWTTSRSIDATLSQILHLVPDDEGDILVFDQVPFGGSFPTATWIPTMNETDTIVIDLSEDIQAGSYTLYTGLYDTETGERITIDATEAVNNLMPITQISITDD